MHSLDRSELDRCLFGEIASLDEIFDGFAYTPVITEPEHAPSYPRPRGFYAVWSEVPGIVEVVPQRAGVVLSARPRPQVVAAVASLCKGGRLDAFKLVAWPRRGYTLVAANDAWLTAHPWIALIATARILPIHRGNTEHWWPCLDRPRGV